MSLHFLLGLPYNVSEEVLEKTYKRNIVETHPDRSKKDTKDLYYRIRKAYEDYKHNLTNENFFLECSVNEVDTIICRCGTTFDKYNLVYDKIECETCSCFLIVTEDLKSISR
jgi:hypothetical protein